MFHEHDMVNFESRWKELSLTGTRIVRWSWWFCCHSFQRATVATTGDFQVSLLESSWWSLGSQPSEATTGGHNLQETWPNFGKGDCVPHRLKYRLQATRVEATRRMEPLCSIYALARWWSSPAIAADSGCHRLYCKLIVHCKTRTTTTTTTTTTMLLVALLRY